MDKIQSSKSKREHTNHCVSYSTEEFGRTIAKLFPLPIKWFFSDSFVAQQLLMRELLCREVSSSSGDTEAAYWVRKIEKRSF